MFSYKAEAGKMLRRIRWYMWILIAVLAVYVGISVYFMEHFFIGTTVNGQNADLLSVSQVNTLLLEEAHAYELILEARDGQKEQLQPSGIGVAYSAPEETRQIKREQNGFLWPRMFWQKDSYTILPEAAIDEDIFSEALTALSCVKNGEEPENASIEMTEAGYEIYEEKPGTQIRQSVLAEQVQRAVLNLETVLNLEAAGCYEEPEITTESPEFTELKEQLDKWLETSVTYEFGPETEVVDRALISQWITIDGYEASFDAEAIPEYIKGLADRRDTYKKSRTFHSTLRGEIKVKGGSYGWQIDQEKERAALLQHVTNGETVTKEPAYARTGRAWGMNSDIGDTYIEVDMGAQHMWFYKNGKLVVDTDVVTGNISKNYGTPAIVADIKYKDRNAVLRGADYATPVKYWMPFYGNYGIHDASWRRSFGGDIYLTNGSHGCVNTPPAAMKVIFENAEKGTPVVLYY